MSDNIYHIPENEQDIDEIYVVLSKDEKGEGIVAHLMEMGAMPMIFCHKRMIDKIKPLIKKIAKDTGKTLYIAKFKKVEVIEKVSGSN